MFFHAIPLDRLYRSFLFTILFFNLFVVFYFCWTSMEKKEKFWIGNWTNNSKKFKFHLNNHYLAVFHSFYVESSMLLRRIVRIDEIGTIICNLVDFNEKKTRGKALTSQSWNSMKIDIYSTYWRTCSVFPYFCFCCRNMFSVSYKLIESFVLTKCFAKQFELMRNNKWRESICW